MIVPRYYENLKVLHDGTMPARAYYIPASRRMEELVEDPSLVFISHGDCLDEAEELGRAIKAKYPVQRMVYNHVGPVIGNHTGAGVIALFFVGKHK